MDSFGKSPHHALPVVKDILTTSSAAHNKNVNNQKSYIPESKDSLSLSQKEFTLLEESVKASNITDIESIKDAATFKDLKGFDFNRLTDYQLTRLISIVRNNIAENIAEVIYNTKNNERLLEITAKEKAFIDNILVKLRQSQINNINQAIDFVKSHSSDNPNLLSKISSRLLNIVANNEQQTQPQTIDKDRFTSSISMEATKFTNPFRSNSSTRGDIPKTSGEAKEFLNQILTTNKNERDPSINPQAINDMSNLILANYLRNNNNLTIPEEMLQGSLKQISSEDQVWLHEKKLHSNVSYLNDVAAKVASEKAQTIIICRLAGETGCATVAALGMASLVGSSPLIGIVGAFILTMAATILGFIVGKTAGEGFGKILTGTNFDTADYDDHKELESEIKRLELNRQQQQQQDSQQEGNSDENKEESEKESTNPEKPKVLTFDEIDHKVSDALRSKVIYRKK